MIDERYQNRIEALEQRNERLRRDNEVLTRELDQTRQLLDICTAKLPNDVDSDSDIELENARLTRELQEAREQLSEIKDAHAESSGEVVVLDALLAAARAKLEECERDAQRYRWLRTHETFLNESERQRLDAIADAAIAQDNEP